MALILLFPPFDQHSIAISKASEFAGFGFYFDQPQYGEVNSGVLLLEVFVVLINGALLWLILRDKSPELTPEEAYALAAKLHAHGGK
jgi:hypothetical protein